MHEKDICLTKICIRKECMDNELQMHEKDMGYPDFCIHLDNALQKHG